MVLIGATKFSRVIITGRWDSVEFTGRCIKLGFDTRFATLVLISTELVVFIVQFEIEAHLGGLAVKPEEVANENIDRFFGY